MLRCTCVRKTNQVPENKTLLPVTFYSTIAEDIKQMQNYLQTKDFQVLRGRKMEIASLHSVYSSVSAKFLMINCRLYLFIILAW